MLGARLASCKYGWQNTYCSLGQRRCAALKLQLLVGAKVLLNTEASSGEWRATQGPYALDGPHYPNRSLFDGVRYDQELDQPDWAAANCSVTGWGAARRVVPPWEAAGFATQLELHTMPPVAVSPAAGRPPASVRSVGADAFLFDFGENLAGFVTVSVPPTPILAPASELRVEVEHAELLTGAGGRIFNQFASPPHSPSGCAHYGSCALQTDTYRLSDLSRGVLLSPGTLTYKGFRYVEVRGLPNVSSSAVRAFSVASDVRPTASFHSNHSLLNKINAAIGATVLANLVSIPTDCPTREKRGWMGDAQWSAEDNAARWDMRLLYRNWVGSMAGNVGEVD